MRALMAVTTAAVAVLAVQAFPPTLARYEASYGEARRGAAREGGRPATVALGLGSLNDQPRVFLLDLPSLAKARALVRATDTFSLPAWIALKSQAPYWWPNPRTPDGLPYVQRDGERNPEINKIIDHQSMDRMAGAVETLALTAYFGGEEKYAQKAAQLLRAWFIDPATRMNPHLQYGQGIPGITTGRGIGLIETRGLTRVVDAVGVLETTDAWTAENDRAVRDWFSRFLTWMRESKNGRDESAAKNNHGTYYDLQVASFALFVDRPEIAREVLAAARQKRIAVQIEPDGRQPLELARTRSWSYSVMNINGLTQLADLGQRVHVDLRHFATRDGRSIRGALRYLAPYAVGERTWTRQQISGWTPEELFPVLRHALYDVTEDRVLIALIHKVPPPAPADRANLTNIRVH